MNKPLDMICIIPKNQCTFCVQCECFINTLNCPVCLGSTLSMAVIIDKTNPPTAPTAPPLTHAETKLYEEGSALLKQYRERLTIREV